MNAGEHADKKSQTSWARTLLSVLGMAVVVIGLFFALRTWVFTPYQIPSGSMEQTVMTGDTLLSEKVSYYFRAPEAGDIITFEDPLVPGRTLLKRVIATEGQTVNLVDGRVVVDGVTLDEPYTAGKQSFPITPTARDISVDFPYTVPEGYVWVMGDNRTSSQDSRYFGAVPVSSITGRAALVYWPVGSFKTLS